MPNTAAAMLTAAEARFSTSRSPATSPMDAPAGEEEDTGAQITPIVQRMCVKLLDLARRDSIDVGHLAEKCEMIPGAPCRSSIRGQRDDTRLPEQLSSSPLLVLPQSGCGDANKCDRMVKEEELRWDGAPVDHPSQEPMNDVSDVLAAIFDCLHQAFSHFGDCGAKVKAKSCTTCIAHDLFGMNINEMVNFDCGPISRGSLYRQYFYYIDAASLREMKVKCNMMSFDEIIKEMRSFLYDEDDGGCEALHQGCLHIVRPPHFFQIVLGWENMYVSVDFISETLGAITTEIDLGVVYCGVNRGCKRRLVSMVCLDDTRFLSKSSLIYTTEKLIQTLQRIAVTQAISAAFGSTSSFNLKYLSAFGSTSSFNLKYLSAI